MDVLLIAGVPAAVWALLVGLLARGRQVPVAPWTCVTFVAALLMFMASIALPSLNPGSGRAVAGVIQISGAVWCLLAPIFILRRPRREPSKASKEREPCKASEETDGTVEMAKLAGMTEMLQIAEWVDDAADMSMDMPSELPIE
jgi:hypothetical protein